MNHTRSDIDGNFSIEISYADLYCNLREYISHTNLSLNKIRSTIKEIVSNCVFSGRSLNVLNWNAQCLNQKKFTDLKSHLDDWTRAYSYGLETTRHFIDIISISESWLKKNSELNNFRLRNYNSVSVCRELPKSGGGLVVFIRKEYPFTVVEQKLSDEIEYILLKVIVASVVWHVFCVYRPHHSKESFIDEIEQILTRSEINIERFVMTGDININLFDDRDPDVLRYNDLLTSMNVAVVNSAVTRCNPIIGVGSLIDHILICKSHTSYVTMTSTRVRSMSDHNFVILMLDANVKPENKVPKRIKRINYESVVSEVERDLAQLNEILEDEKDVNVYFNYIHDCVMNAVTSNTRFLTVKQLGCEFVCPPWVNAHYVEMTNTLHNLQEKIGKRLVNNLECNQLEEKFKDLSEIREKYGIVIAKKFYRELEIKDLRHAWSIINELLGKSQEKAATVIKTGDGELVVDASQIAYAYQEKFLSIVGVYGANDPAKSCDQAETSTDRVFSFENVTPEYIRDEIDDLELGKAVGRDGISAKILKKIKSSISGHLCCVFNLMISSTTYVDRLKVSTIVPIPKTKNSMDIDNVRPISILLQMDKIFESIMFKQINSFVEEEKVMDNFQYGFRCKRGCQDALTMILHHISRAIDNGKSVLILSLDVQKAFDSVNLEVLMRKLEHIGIRGSASALMKSFLTGRLQSVKFENVYSGYGEIKRGVPQGSNLGPLLFNLMINDLSLIPLNSTLYKYADDLCVVHEIDHSQGSQINMNGLINDINAILNYYESNCLEINCSKSKYMILGKPVDSMNDYLQSKNIEQCSTITYLGVYLDDELKMASQVDNICSSLAQSINALRFLKRNLSSDALIKFFHAHIQSKISYCGFVLLRARSIDIERIQRLQSKALKLVFDLPNDYPTYQLFTEKAPKVLPVTGLVYYSAITMVHKSYTCTDGSLPQIQKLRTNRRCELLIGAAKKKIMQNDIGHDGVKLFNQLPDSVKSELNAYLFKEQLKKHLLSRNESLIKSGQFAAKNFNI